MLLITKKNITKGERLEMCVSIDTSWVYEQA